MTDDHILKILKEVAKEQGISSTILERAWRNQFRVLRDTIVGSTKNEVETFNTVYIKYMGKFIPKRGLIRRMKEHAIKKESEADS